jgi:hypothetical protein
MSHIQVMFNPAYIYQFVLTLLVWVVCLPFGGYQVQMGIIHLVVMGISLFFGLSTVVWLWKRLRRINSARCSGTETSA